MKFYPLTIKDIRRETRDSVSLSFDVPREWSENFRYTQGQYLTFRADIQGEDIRRSYSICSAPHEEEIRVAVKQVADGKFSTFANHKLKQGDVLEAMPPMGHFNTILHPEQAKNYVFFAAGSGITPVISNIKAILNTEPNSFCTLLYGNQRVHTIIFKEEIEALKNVHLGRLQIFNVLSREHTESYLLNGRLDKEKIKKFFQIIPHLLKADEYFACGPEEMLESVTSLLTEANIHEKNIHVEWFEAPKNKPSIPVSDLSVDSRAIITIDGLTLDVPVQKGQTILDAAQAFGTDMPYACKGGVCCTCRAKLTGGEVDMTANYSLTKEEIDRGFILTCQSLPRTPEVKIDFDIK